MTKQKGIKMSELPQNIIKVNIFNIFDNTYSEGIINLNSVTYTKFDNELNLTRVFFLHSQHPILIKEKI